MRYTSLFLSAAVLLAACSDTPQPTAPGRAGNRAAAFDKAPTNDGIKLPDAKPKDQVGFTTVTQVASVLYTVPPGTDAQEAAHCPAGSTPISGGYFIETPGPANARPFVRYSMAGGSDAWTVQIENIAPGAGTVRFVVMVYCAR